MFEPELFFDSFYSRWIHFSEKLISFLWKSFPVVVKGCSSIFPHFRRGITYRCQQSLFYSLPNSLQHDFIERFYDGVKTLRQLLPHKHVLCRVELLHQLAEIPFGGYITNHCSEGLVGSFSQHFISI